MPILPSRTLRRGLIGGLAVLAATGAGVATIATRPASTSTTTVQLAQPASDEPTTTATTAEAEVAQDVVRAETAATKAETAAVRAEGAAAHVDQVAATTTTTPATVPPATTQTLTVVAPPVDEAPTTTTTTVPAKQWVEIGRFPVGNFDPDVPAHITVTFQTGVVRVTGLVSSGAVWLGGGDEPSSCAGGPIPPTIMASTAATCPARSDWPLGEQVLGGGQIYAGRAVSGFDSSRPVVVEEYR